MNASVIAPAEATELGHAALHMAMETERPQHEAVEAAMVLLGDALDNYGELDARTLHWSVIWPHLRDEAHPDEAAMRKAAEEVEAATEGLIEALAAHGGTEDEMKNAAGGM